MSPKTKRAPYQDKWRDGRLVQKGRRECAKRFEVIRDTIRREVAEQARVLDVGGWDGYFARRLSEAGMDLTIMEPRKVPDLKGTGIRHIQQHMTPATIDGLTFYGASLLLSVLHHMQEWEDVYSALRAKCRVIIAELAVPEEVAEGRSLSPTLTQTRPQIGPSSERLLRDGKIIHTGPGPNGVDRPMVLVRNFCRGVVEDGGGRASAYMADESLPDSHWAPLGYTPHPGTLNVKGGKGGRMWASHMPNGVGESTDKLRAPYWPVWIGRVPGHARLSGDKEVVELVAACHLRTELGLSNGDEVEITVR